MRRKLTRRQILKLLALAAGSSLTVLTKKSLTPRTLAGEQESNYLPITQRDLTPTPTSTPIPSNTIRPTRTVIGAPTQTSTPTRTPTGTPTTPGVPSVTPTHTPTSTSAVPTTPPPPPASNRVVHVHSPNASNWNGGSTDYWNYVNQGVVDNMVDQGMMILTGTSSVEAAWSAVLPNYQAGQKVAIKVSFNNTGTCDENSGEIDSIIEPVNAVIRGLLTIGVGEQDIWVYDAIRALPYRFINGCDYDNVQFYGTGSCNIEATFVSNDPTAYVTYNPPPGGYILEPQRITDLIINADYLINMPIMKGHVMSGVSLAFKNHYGTTQNPVDLHNYSAYNSDYYTSEYSPFIDLYNSPHIRGKTILTLSDSIYCARGNSGNSAYPVPWQTFGNDYPKSLLFSLDPVAIDSVMLDLYDAEFEHPNPKNDDYLILANNAGIGTFEHGDPWGSGYDLIDYQKIEI